MAEIINCHSCGKPVPDTIKICPYCRKPCAAPPPPPPPPEPVVAMPRVIKKSDFIGLGCIVQLIGVALLFVFPLGTLLGFALLVYGSTLSKKYLCSVCNNKIDNEDVKVCPACHTMFVK